MAVVCETKCSMNTIVSTFPMTVGFPKIQLEKDLSVVDTDTCMENVDELQLIEEAKENTQSFGKLYDLYFPRVYAFIAAKVNNRHDAEDLVSDIFIKILENLPRYEDRGFPFAAWVFRIARNRLNDYYSEHGKQQTDDIDAAFDLAEDEEKTSPVKKARQEELRFKVKEILDTLPEKELNVVQLKFFGQLNNREITHVTGLSESNVAVILYRTLKKIKPDLAYFA